MDQTILLTLYGIAFVLVVILIIGWIILPFAIIGTKPLLRELLEEQRATNAMLNRAELERLRAAGK